jgi:thioredoxin reductase
MPDTGAAITEKWYPRNVVAAGFIAIGSGPAGLSAAETFRSKHPHIPVRILTTDPALPYAKPPLSKAYPLRAAGQARPAQPRLVRPP